jgi:hypothetical protein
MSGSCARNFAINTRRFIPPDKVMIFESFRSQSDRSRSTRSITPGSDFLPNRPQLKLTVFQTVSNASVVSSWGTSPIRARDFR